MTSIMLSAIAACVVSLAHPTDSIQLMPILTPREMPPIVETPAKTFTTTFALGPYDPGFAWDEMVPSWSLRNADKLSIRIQASLTEPSEGTYWYDFGTWTQVPSLPRMSFRNSKTEFAEVQTDTLVLKSPQRPIWIRCRLEASVKEDLNLFPFITLGFRNSKAEPPAESPNRAAWGKTIEVPMRSQMSYEGGNVLCSPTCVSMLLWHWSKEERKPEWNLDVPVVAAGVFDPNWPGTGNWPFNTAFAGSIPGIRSYVARFGGIQELEDWIAAGIPVATSVSSALLKGRPKKEPSDGHLVVLIGFTKDGDPVFNDPGRSVEVRQTYRREHFSKAWATSGNTVYLMHPETRKPPPNRLGHWLD